MDRRTQELIAKAAQLRADAQQLCERLLALQSEIFEERALREDWRAKMQRPSDALENFAGSRQSPAGCGVR